MSQVVESILLSDDLPSPPGVAVKLLEIFSQPNVEVQDMASIISADAVLSAKLIEYCNSPLFARARETTNVRQAIVLMGMKAVKILALSFSLVQTTSKNRGPFDYDRFWNQSLAAAASAKAIAEKVDCNGDDAFLIGMMLRVGQVGLAHTFPHLYCDLMQQSDGIDSDLLQLETKEWGENRYSITAGLLEHWNFPSQLTEAIAEFSSTECATKDRSTMVKALSLADAFSEILGNEEVYEDSIAEARELAATLFNFNEDAFQELFNSAMESWLEFGKVLEFSSADAASFEQLERKAIKRIAQLSIGLQEENEVMREQNAELKITAMFDRLTGLKNRRAYDEEANGEWERTKRSNGALVLVMADIDHFKNVNDTHGHAIGDVALVDVSEALRANTRGYDFVYRFGGEEFVILLTDCSPQDALQAVERFRVGIEQLQIPIPDGTIQITASFGVAIHRHPGVGSIDDLMLRADELLYQAKKEGRNRICSNFDEAESITLT